MSIESLTMSLKNMIFGTPSHVRSTSGAPATHLDQLDRASAELENETIGLRRDLSKLASSRDPIAELAARMRASRAH